MLGVVGEGELEADLLALELGGEGREGIRGGDAGDGGAVEGLLTGRDADDQFGHASLPVNRELNEHAAALVAEAGAFGDDGEPVAADGGEDPDEVGPEVDALRVA